MIPRGMVLARLVVVAATAPLALGACYRDRPPGGALENRTAEAHTAASNDPLAFLPVDAEVVFGLDARQLFASPLWKHFEPRVMPRIARGAQDFQAACGYDPFATVRSVTLGLKVSDSIDGIEGVVVARGLDRDRTMACVDRALSRRGKITIEGRFVTVPGDGDAPPMVMAFADAATLVLATSRAKLDAALSSGAPLRRSRAFSELWALVDAKQAVWALVNGSARAFDILATTGRRPRAIVGSVALDDGLSLSGRLRLGTADEATQLASLARSQLGPAGSMVERIEIGAEGADVTLRVEMTMGQVDALARMMFGMWGSPLGGP